MNNIEKLAIEHGATLIEEDTGQWDGMPMYVGEIVFHDKAQLEAFAKALQQSSEPVAEVCYMTIDGDSNLGGIKWLQNKYTSPISTKLFTHPPASVPLEKYNKLLDALKYYRDTAHIYDKNNFSYFDPRQVAINAIAEAEGKEG